MDEHDAVVLGDDGVDDGDQLDIAELLVAAVALVVDGVGGYGSPELLMSASLPELLMSAESFRCARAACFRALLGVQRAGRRARVR